MAQSVYGVWERELSGFLMKNSLISLETRFEMVVEVEKAGMVVGIVETCWVFVG